MNTELVLYGYRVPMCVQQKGLEMDSSDSYLTLSCVTKFGPKRTRERDIQRQTE